MALLTPDTAGVWRRGRAVFLAVLCLAVWMQGPCLGAPVRLTDYEVIASYLPVFLRYVQWPETALPQAGRPLRIGILGRDPFGASLERVIQSKLVMGRRVETLRDTSAERLLDCQIIFVNVGGVERLKALSFFSGRPILTVIYADDRAGGLEQAAIQFVLSGTNVRYHLNMSVLGGSGLHATQGLIENALPKGVAAVAESRKGEASP